MSAFRERARVLFHLNGYTKVVLERTEGLGLTDGAVSCDIPTRRIPFHLRQIGSVFVIQTSTLSDEELNDPDALHDVKNRFTIEEV